MCFDYSRLKGKIIERYGSQTAFTKDFGVSSNTFSLKMNNKIRFSSDDVLKMISLLDIPEDEIGSYFFTKEV